MNGYTRRVEIKIEVDIWKWPDATVRDTIDITKDALNYRFQKSIKNPQSTCQISLLPQRDDKNIVDILKPMDVIRIYEFGVLKFIGYVQRMSYSGSIGADGKPNRMAVLTCQHMGGLLSVASIGLGLGTALGKAADNMVSSSVKLSLALADAVQGGGSFASLVKAVVDNFLTYLKDIEATNITAYFNKYFNTEKGLVSTSVPRIPRTYTLYSGTELSLTVWQVLEQLVERPFNEMWIDNGPRTVSIDGKNVNLPEASCLVFRSTPFDGTVPASGSPGTAFDNLPSLRIDRDHLVSFDLARSMDEVYTFYSVKEAAFQLSDMTRLLLGQAIVDKERLGTYLLKPLVTELFFTRMENPEGSDKEKEQKEMLDIAKRSSQTLYNWFKNNDQYLSGAVSIMVPSDNKDDPKIGQKIEVDGIEGFFYVEGIAHLWSYRGPLRSDLSVTRGFQRNGRMELTDRIFRRSVTS